ncbi:MAG: transporter permease [Thermomicrobiales bacterium]|nr:transporter permease [Thermomicrobiales bacterium]
MSVSATPLTSRRREPLPSPSGGGLPQRRRRTGMYLIIPALVVMAAVILFPIGRSIVLSFQEAKLTAGEIGTAWTGGENYRRISEDETFTLALRNSAFFTIAEVLLVLIIALGVALLLNTRAGRNPIYATILLVPWVIAPVANAVLWKWILHANYGALNALLTGFGITDRYVNWLGTPGLALRMLLLADVWKSVPFIALILLAGLQNIPPALYKAAKLDGANTWQRFRYVTLSGLRTPLALAVVLQTIWSFKVFDLIFVLTKAGPADATYGAAIANIIFLIMFVLALVLIRLLKPGAPRSRARA